MSGASTVIPPTYRAVVYSASFAESHIWRNPGVKNTMRQHQTAFAGAILMEEKPTEKSPCGPARLCLLVDYPGREFVEGNRVELLLSSGFPENAGGLDPNGAHEIAVFINYGQLRVFRCTKAVLVSWHRTPFPWCIDVSRDVASRLVSMLAFTGLYVNSDYLFCYGLA